MGDLGHLGAGLRVTPEDDAEATPSAAGADMRHPASMSRRLERWLHRQGHAGRVVSYQLITGGYSRVMARVEIVRPDSSSEVLVMRGDPPPEMQTLETDRDREWAVLSWLTESGAVPTPAARWYETDPAWFGTKAIFLDFEPGPSLQSVLEAGCDHQECSVRLCDLMGAVGRIQTEALPSTFERPESWDDYVDVRLARWHAIAEGHVEALPTVRYLACWLDAHRPEPAPLRLVHGDLQPSNILISPSDEWRLIDWEFAHIGDPREELGYYFAYTQGVPPNVIGDLSGFLARYRALTGLSESIVNPASIAWWTTVATLAVVEGLHEGIAGLARGERHGVALSFNTILVTIGYQAFMAAVERIEQMLAGTGA